MVRVVDGEPTQGSFVPPYAYEMYLRGELLLQAGHARAAAEAFEHALLAPELDPYVVARLAYALGLSGQTTQAEARLRQVEQLSPCLPELWLARGRLAQHAGDAEAALTAFEHAVACAPEDAEAQRARLELTGELGTDTRSESGFTQAAVAPVELRRRQLRDAIEAGEVEQVRRLFARERLDPALPWPLAARAHAALGECEMAARAWVQAAPLAPADLPDASVAFARASYWPEAEAAARAALAQALAPEDEQAMHMVLAGSLWAEGQVGAALAALPADASREQLARWLEQQGLTGLARELRARP